MKKFTTFLMGLSLLVVGCIGFLGCADNNGPGGSGGVSQQGTPVRGTLNLPSFAPANANNPHALAHPANGLIAQAELGQMTFLAPVGYSLSVPANSNLTFSQNVTGALPMTEANDGTGNLVTEPGYVAELPAGVISMYFPDITLTYLATGKTLVLKSMTVVFTITSTFWTMPSSTYFTVNRLANGYYLINGSIAQAIWPNGSAPTTCVLAGQQGIHGMQLMQNGVAVYTLSIKSFTSVNNVITVTGNDVVPFDTIAYPTFTFTQ